MFECITKSNTNPMIKLETKLPRHFYLACSGGVDSMACLDFLSKNHDVTVLHYNHGTAHGHIAERFVRGFCYKRRINYHVGVNREPPPPGLSREAFWREKRYNFLNDYSNAPIVTCHHLDDCVETWVWSCMHGNPRTIPYRRKSVIRPFRLTRKRDFQLWCDMHNVPYVEDESNEDIHYTRNYIRREMMPSVLKVNPGIHKTVKKIILKETSVAEVTTPLLSPSFVD